MKSDSVNLLELLAKRHNDWLKMARKLGAKSAEDVVQDMYLRLHTYVDNADRICYEHNEVNTFYVYCTLKNIVINEANAASKCPEFIAAEDIKNASDIIFQFEEYDHDLDEILEIAESEIDQWYWYDKELFKVYFKDGLSIRKLSEETKISTSSIFNTLKNGKKKIKQRLREEGKL